MLTSAIVDPFSGEALGAQWSGSYGGADVSDGVALVPCAHTGGTPDYAGLQTAAGYELDDVWCLLDPAAASGASGYAYSALAVLSGTAGTSLHLRVDTVAGTLRCESNVGYFDAGATEITYDPVAHRLLRITRTGGGILWRVSQDGLVWTTLRTLTAPAWTGDADLAVLVECARDSGTNNTAIVDSVNRLPWAGGGTLCMRLRVAFGANVTADPSTWTWTEITPYLHLPAEVNIGWGRSDRAEQAETSSMSLTLKNVDGRFTAYHPISPYWPNVVKWTPISLDIDLGDGTGWRNRFSGFVRRWPVSWPGRSSRQALARIDAVGILGRIGRGSPPARSPLFRAITSRALAGALLAYWPCEDAADSDRAASGISGRAGLNAVGAVTFSALDPSQSAGGTFRYGTMPLPDLSAGGGLVGGTAPAGASSPVEWTVQWTAEESDSTSVPGALVLLSWRAGDSLWEVVLSGPASYNTLLRVDGVTRVEDSFSYLGFFGWRVHAIQFGGNIQATLTVDNVSLGDVTPGGGSPYTASWAGTLGWPTSDIGSNPAATASSPAQHLIGHIQVWDGDAPVFNASGTDGYGRSVSAAHFAYGNEAAHDQLVRLAAEDGVTCTVTATPDSGLETRMGTQPDATALDLYQQCETADQGLIYETGWGLGYVPRADRYNAPVALTIDASARELGDVEPVDDDANLRNVWTVSRPGGSSATVEDPDSVAKQGPIPASVQARIRTDSQLEGHAWWRLRQTTVADPRYPTLPIDLGASRDLAAAWCTCIPGSRVQVMSPPEQAAPGIDQLIVGATETYRGRRRWRASLSVIPASPWQIAEIEHDQLSYLGSDGSTVASDFAAGTDTSLSVAVASGYPLWDDSDAPFHVEAGGVVLNVTAISGSSSPQTFAVDATPINGVIKTISAGDPVDVAYPAHLGLSGG